MFATFQYIAVIILFDAKNSPSMAGRTLQLAPGPVFDSLRVFWYSHVGPSCTFPPLIRNLLFLQEALVPFSVPDVFKGVPLG